jgi:WD40 repeat protein
MGDEDPQLIARTLHRQYADEAFPHSRVIRGHADRINDAAITHDNRYLLTALEDATLRTWQLP